MSLLTLTLAACSDHNLHLIELADEPLGPHLLVEPQQLDFGTARVDGWKTMSFTVTNISQGELHVGEVYLKHAGEGFGLSDEGMDFLQGPGASEEVEVLWTPFGVDQENVVLVESSDPEVRTAEVELRGRGLVPELAIEPDPYDFGNTFVGCRREGELSLTNVGTEALDVLEIEHGDEGFELELPQLPFTLEPGQSVPLSAAFEPPQASTFEGPFTVFSTEPRGQREAQRLGEGSHVAEYAQSWELPEDPPSDILFLVDQSSSMKDDQERLAENFGWFIQHLKDYTSDWQILVVTTDDGCTLSGVLDAHTVDYEATFAEAVSSGGRGKHTESLLTPAAFATAQAGLGDCNEGFLREEAILHVIAVSDEPEQSPYTSGWTWSEAVAEMIANKGSSTLLRISAIVGDYPDGCGSAQAGTGYYEAANYTGGSFLSICAEDWSSYMDELASGSVVQDSFELEVRPVEASIRVQVNGVERLSGWGYDAARNAVVFEKGIPQGGDVVRIEHGELASCD